jgi:hypothetical protein
MRKDLKMKKKKRKRGKKKPRIENQQGKEKPLRE